jgi:solute carrier family 25 oxoglutarate transporter 11
MEPLNHFKSSVKILNSIYEWPKTRSEKNIFFKEVLRLPEFWPELYKKVSFGLVAGGGDIAVKLAAWQYFYGGTNSPSDYADWNTFKYLTCAIVASTLTCANTVPFETARRAYFADRTWPKELRRGYTSPLNALARIPFEEGPAYLFKGGLPIIAS